MTKPCIIIATFSPKPEFYDEALAILKDITLEVHEEAGCELYALHEEVNGRIVFVERWTTTKDWHDHLTLDTVARIQAGMKGKVIADVDVMEMYGVLVGTPEQGAL